MNDKKRVIVGGALIGIVLVVGVIFCIIALLGTPTAMRQGIVGKNIYNTKMLEIQKGDKVRHIKEQTTIKKLADLLAKAPLEEGENMVAMGHNGIVRFKDSSGEIILTVVIFENDTIAINNGQKYIGGKEFIRELATFTGK